MREQSIDDIDSIRKRPGMYIGDVHDGSGLHHMIWEVLANALDQFFAGRCTRVDVTLHSDGSISVRDDGAGISVAAVETGTPWLEHILTTFHQTPTADGHAPHFHLVPFRVGLCVVSALSSLFSVEVRRDGRTWRIETAHGRVTSRLTPSGPAETTGTTVRFTPDSAIFTTLGFDAGLVVRRLREISSLVPRLTTSFSCEPLVFEANLGLADLLKHPRPNAEHEHPVIGEARHGHTIARVAFAWCSYPREPSIRGFCNLELIPQGAHLDGFRFGLAKAFRRRDHRRVFDALSRGLNAVLSVDILDPTFEGPTKERLTSIDARNVVRDATARALEHVLVSDPQVARAVAARLKPA
jgi:DNA gyrase subunit B